MKKYTVSTSATVPTSAITKALEKRLLDVTADTFENFKKIIAEVNEQMRNNAIKEVLEQPDIFKALYQRVTFGRYSVTNGKDGYSLKSTNKIMKKVAFEENGETKKEERPDFLTYADVTAYVIKRNAEIDKANKDSTTKTAKITMNGDISKDQKFYMSIFGHYITDTITEKDLAKLEKLQEQHDFLKCFDRTSKTAKIQQLQYLFAVLEKHIGVTGFKAIGSTIENLPFELKKYSSKIKEVKIADDDAVISAVFNEMINASLKTSVKNKLSEI